MNERDCTRMGIDNNRTEGSIKQTAGGIKEDAADLLADEELQRSGQAARGEGKLKKTLGIAKDKARDSEIARG
jgi:uncharacterized protein YjbJ (UPF0337 family)